MSSFTGKSCEPRNVSHPSFPLSSFLPPITFCRCPEGFYLCVSRLWRKRREGPKLLSTFLAPLKQVVAACERRQTDTRLRAVTWNGKSPSESISRWSIRRRLIIQTGRAQINFSQRLSPLVTAKHCIKSNSRSYHTFTRWDTKSYGTK